MHGTGVSAPRASLLQLGEVELAALEHLWRRGDANVSETHAAVGRPRAISLNTVGSALERLYRKGLASREKVSHAYRYRAAVGPEEFAARRVLEAASGTEALSRVGMLSAFVDLVAEVDEDLLAHLEALIGDKRRGDR